MAHLFVQRRRRVPAVAALTALSALTVTALVWAPWCAPCRIVGPVVEEVAESMAGSLKVCKVNVDENPVSAQTYEIRSIPTLIVFSGGNEASRMVGVRPKDEIEKEIKAAIK